MFQKSGLKHIATTDIQKDCLEKSTREESGGSEEAMTKTGAKTAILYSPHTREGGDNSY